MPDTPAHTFDGTPDDDPLFTKPEQSDETPLDTVREAAAQALAGTPEELPHIPVPVPSRPGITLLCDPNLGVSTFQYWQRRAENPQVHGDVDQLRLAVTVLANQTVDVLHNGQPTGWNFKQSEFWKTLGAKSATDAVRALFGKKREPLVLAASLQIIAEAGLEEGTAVDEVTGAGPTTAP